MWCLQVKTYAVNSSSGHTFYVMAADGSAPDREKVNKACLDIGGKLVHPGASACPPGFVDDTVSRQRRAGCQVLPEKTCITLGGGTCQEVPVVVYGSNSHVFRPQVTRRVPRRRERTSSASHS